MTQVQLPPDTRVVFQPDPAGDMDKVVDALKAMQATGWIFPTGDTTGASDLANAAAALAANGCCLMGPGTFYISAPITPGTRNLLQGCGDGTIIKPGSGFSGSYMVQLAHAATTVEVTMRDFQLSIGYASGVGGVQLDNTGYTDPGGALGLTDTLHTVENVLVVEAGADGFHFDNAVRELRVRGCKAYNSLGYGFFLGNSGGAGSGCTDSHFTDCTAGNAALHGWNILDGNNMFTSCKAFGGGYNAQTATYGSTQAGFEVASTGTHLVFAACSAQQNALYGFDLQGTTHVSVTGCEADSNGAGSGTPAGIGINNNGSTDCIILGNVGNQSVTPGNQLYGIQQNGTTTGTYYAFNAVKGSTSTFNYVAGNGYYLLDGLDVVDFTQMRIMRLGSALLYETGSTTGGSPQTLVTGDTIAWFASAGTYAVTSAAAVTGIIVGSAPTPAADFGGALITIINTGSFPVTFAAAGTSNVADGTMVSIPAGCALGFVWDTYTALWYPQQPAGPVQQATTGAGYALVNGTGTIISWTAPNDGLIHRFTIYAGIHVTSTETGGQVTVAYTLPDGTAPSHTLFAAGIAAGDAVPASDLSVPVKAGTTVSVKQATALTGGAATMWAEIWGA